MEEFVLIKTIVKGFAMKIFDIADEVLKKMWFGKCNERINRENDHSLLFWLRKDIFRNRKDEFKSDLINKFKQEIFTKFD